MELIKYHPLINDGGADMIPMFIATDITAVAGNKFYLEEIIPRYYRFCSKDAVFNDKASEYHIHCPYCGKIMTAIASPTDLHKHSLYVCRECNGTKDF